MVETTSIGFFSDVLFLYNYKKLLNNAVIDHNSRIHILCRMIGFRKAIV